MEKFFCLKVKDINTYAKNESIAIEVEKGLTITISKEALLELFKDSLDHNIISIEEINNFNKK